MLIKNSQMKGCLKLIRISKDEANELRRRFGKRAYIVRLNKQKSKIHKYLCSEEPHIINALEEMRGAPVVAQD